MWLRREDILAASVIELLDLRHRERAVVDAHIVDGAVEVILPAAAIATDACRCSYATIKHSGTRGRSAQNTVYINTRNAIGTVCANNKVPLAVCHICITSEPSACVVADPEAYFKWVAIIYI